MADALRVEQGNAPIGSVAGKGQGGCDQRTSRRHVATPLRSTVRHSANLSMVTLFTVHLMLAIENAGPYVEFCVEDSGWVNGRMTWGMMEPSSRDESAKLWTARCRTSGWRP